MLPTIRQTLIVSSALLALVLTGCAGDPLGPGTIARHYRHTKSDRPVARKDEPAKIDTGSIAKELAPVTTRDDPRWQWCEQRHVDHQAGKAPGGATDLAKKLDDDRICAAVYEQRG